MQTEKYRILQIRKNGSKEQDGINEKDSEPGSGGKNVLCPWITLFDASVRTRCQWFLWRRPGGKRQKTKKKKKEKLRAEKAAGRRCRQAGPEIKSAKMHQSLNKGLVKCCENIRHLYE